MTINTGGRFATYALEALRGSKLILPEWRRRAPCSNGDRIIVIAYAQMQSELAAKHSPNIAILNEKNEVVTTAQS